MQQLGFRSVFAKLFASVMLALILFAVAMVLLTQLVHDKNAGIRSEVVATQILGQIDPFLHELNTAISKNNRLQARFMLAVVKKSFDIFDESLQAKMGLYDSQGRLLMQTDNSDLPLELPATPSLLTLIFPSFSDTPPTQQAQVYSSTGYTLLYESRLVPKKPALSAALNLFTGTLLLLMIMAGALWWIARSMTWRINHMSQQMSQLGDGDFTVRVNSRGNDEIALLARGFNQAAQKIEHLIDANNLLLAHASHELRTPITRIRLQIEMMDMLAGSMPKDTKAKFDKRAQAINRDLSGLNDLVESILLVSRLDAGHAMQQVERVDFYDLVNQERQHYPEATLIGEHIVIDGQPPMLTHLIRNLLNNAMLHGVPPVTILLYGVQTLEEADTLPEYLLHSLVCSSFADYSRSNYDKHLDVTGQSKDNQNVNLIQVKSELETPTDVSEPLDVLPTPVIFRNGETLAEHNNKEHGGKNNSDDEAEQSQAISNNGSNRNQITDALAPTISDKTLQNGHSKLSSDLADRIKRMIWNIVPDSQQHSTNDGLSIANIKSVTDKPATTKSINDKGSNKGKITKASNDQNTDGDSESNSTPRKESLFKKHLKKSKSEDERPLPKYAVLAVIDEGAGIPEDKREEIFSPFVRLQQKNKGSGLGLSLVSQIVTAHQGHIVTDTINGHTRFLVVIPVKHDPHRSHDNHS
ncbi:sensor histidine kinase [Psychrobacter sp. P11G5]|uniref:sensor histidine kinase n=1 Tax=Psychrobacter sp. P11G5 TaxID=1699624 RepID=UPI00078DEFB7|nr:sensor histidine kinase [Psychrobacter sp. P11G5]AMN68330.1 ATPase [Psychrobacter sp. P11G5]